LERDGDPRPSLATTPALSAADRQSPRYDELNRIPHLGISI